MADGTDVDVVVIGSGLAGLAGALAAAAAGLQVVVLEQGARVGGASCWSYGALWVAGSDQALAADLPDDRAEAAAYLAYLGGGANDPDRTAALIERSPAALRRLGEAGVAFALMPGVNDILFGRAPGAGGGRTLEPPAMVGAELGKLRPLLHTPPGQEWRVPKSIAARVTDHAVLAGIVGEAVARDQIAQGSAVIARLMLALQARGVRVVVGTAAESLIAERGRIVGVRTASGGWRARRGVLLATGSYLHDMALVAALDQLPGYRAWCPAGSAGDGLRLAAAHGASVRTGRNNLAIMLGYEDPTDADALNVGAPSVRELPRAHVIVVNAAGQRFGNEALFQEMAPALRAFDPRSRQPKNLPCWMVFDAHYLRRWGFAGGPPGVAPDWLPGAPDLASLAGRHGIDPVGLVATVARFNEFAERGVDEDFDRRAGWALTPGAGTGVNPSLGAIAEAPFHAVRLFPTLGVGGGGVKADARARVVDWADAPIPGLYAAGDVALHDEFGAGYQAGLTSAAAITFGFIAAEQMAAAPHRERDRNGA